MTCTAFLSVWWTSLRRHVQKPFVFQRVTERCRESATFFPFIKAFVAQPSHLRKTPFSTASVVNRSRMRHAPGKISRTVIVNGESQTTTILKPINGAAQSRTRSPVTISCNILRWLAKHPPFVLLAGLCSFGIDAKLRLTSSRYTKCQPARG